MATENDSAMMSTRCARRFDDVEQRRLHAQRNAVRAFGHAHGLGHQQAQAVAFLRQRGQQDARRTDMAGIGLRHGEDRAAHHHRQRFGI
jgi:hydrogenase maturation factor HypF (carbamoyltransferase family)